jgi:hypothetical protein
MSVLWNCFEYLTSVRCKSKGHLLAYSFYLVSMPLFLCCHSRRHNLGRKRAGLWVLLAVLMPLLRYCISSALDRSAAPVRTSNILNQIRCMFKEKNQVPSMWEQRRTFHVFSLMEDAERPLYFFRRTSLVTKQLNSSTKTLSPKTPTPTMLYWTSNHLPVRPRHISRSPSLLPDQDRLDRTAGMHVCQGFLEVVGLFTIVRKILPCPRVSVNTYRVEFS